MPTVVASGTLTGATADTGNLSGAPLDFDPLGYPITIVGGTGATGNDQVRRIMSYDAGTGEIVVVPPWAVEPDSTSDYEILEPEAADTTPDVSIGDPTPDPLPDQAPRIRAQRCVDNVRRVKLCPGHPRKIARCSPASNWFPAIAAAAARLVAGHRLLCYPRCTSPTEYLAQANVPHSLLGGCDIAYTGRKDATLGGVYDDGNVGPRFFGRHWKCLDLTRYYRQAPGAPISWRAAPGSIVHTLDDYDSITQWGAPGGVGNSYSPWHCEAQGVPEYFEDEVGLDGNTHAAILRLPFIVDWVKKYMTATTADVYYTDCCSTGTAIGMSLYDHLLAQSGYFQGIPHAVADYSEMLAYYQSLPDSAVLPYPLTPTLPYGTFGVMDGIDTGGIFEVYFDAHFASPWDGTWPTCTGGHVLWQLDPQGISADEPRFWDHYLATNALDGDGVLDQAFTVSAQDADAIDLGYSYTATQDTSISGYDEESDPIECCNEGPFNRTSSEDSTYQGAIRVEKFQLT